MSKFAKERQDNRMKDYKSAFNADEYKKRREESIISVRRHKREENILKRRNINIADIEEEEEEEERNNIMQQLHMLPDFVREIQSQDTNVQISGTIGIRKLLSIQVNPPIDEVIAAGVVPRLVEFLGRTDFPKLQFEAAWALTNIASGSTQQTYFLINAGAIPAFLNQLTSPEVSVREQAVWALGNIAGDSYQCRDRLLQYNSLVRLLPLTAETMKPSLRRNAVWTISNLCRGKPSPPFSYVQPAIPQMVELLSCSDTQIVADSLWALSYISDGDNLRIQAIIDGGVSEKVVQLLMHQSSAVQTPALRVIGNIVTGDEEQTQTVIDQQVLPCLKFLLESPNVKKAMKKELCWTISNITAGTPNQIQAVIESGIFQSLIHHLIFSDFDVKKEAAWAVANATSSGTPEQIKFIVMAGALKPLCDLFEVNEARIVAVALEAIENILDNGEFEQENGNPYADILSEMEVVSVIEKLQLHVNKSIAEKATSIIAKFFMDGSDDDITDDDLVPASNQEAFSFGTQPGSSNFQFA